MRPSMAYRCNPLPSPIFAFYLQDSSLSIAPRSRDLATPRALCQIRASRHVATAPPRDSRLPTSRSIPTRHNATSDLRHRVVWHIDDISTLRDLIAHEARDRSRVTIRLSRGIARRHDCTRSTIESKLHQLDPSTSDASLSVETPPLAFEPYSWLPRASIAPDKSRYRSSPLRRRSARPSAPDSRSCSRYPRHTSIVAFFCFFSISLSISLLLSYLYCTPCQTTTRLD